MHHERWNIPVKKYEDGTVVRSIGYWCGRGGNYLVEKEIPLEGVTDPPSDAPHCKHCLLAKQIKKGEAYMKEHGYPIQPRRKFADHG